MEIPEAFSAKEALYIYRALLLPLYHMLQKVEGKKIVVHLHD
jgi:hypothetical protein